MLCKWCFRSAILGKEGREMPKTPMGRRGQAEIPQEQSDEEAQRPPMESEVSPAPPISVKRKGNYLGLSITRLKSLN
ncbi:hypothetical protein EQV77_15485 [Halobacillus fulvus]|nr:hypothetical protein EQV77_15485 [Halobacillus fulvus]